MSNALFPHTSLKRYNFTPIHSFRQNGNTLPARSTFVQNAKAKDHIYRTKCFFPDVANTLPITLKSMAIEEHSEGFHLVCHSRHWSFAPFGMQFKFCHAFLIHCNRAATTMGVGLSFLCLCFVCVCVPAEAQCFCTDSHSSVPFIAPAGAKKTAIVSRLAKVFFLNMYYNHPSYLFCYGYIQYGNDAEGQFNHQPYFVTSSACKCIWCMLSYFFPFLFGTIYQHSCCTISHRCSNGCNLLHPCIKRKQCFSTAWVQQVMYSHTGILSCNSISRKRVI